MIITRPSPEVLPKGKGSNLFGSNDNQAFLLTDSRKAEVDSQRVVQSNFVSGSCPEHKLPDIFISIQPRHAENILRGVKTIEFRRRFPSPEKICGARVWIYSSSPVKAVVAVAMVKSVDRLPVHRLWINHQGNGGIDKATFVHYFKGVTHGYAICLSHVRRLLSQIPSQSLENVGFCVPQSYRYVTEDIYPLLENAHGENIA